MRFLKQSTSVDLPIGPFLDSGDGVTPETTLTITQPDIRLKKNGGAWAQKAGAQTLTHEENGWYEVTLDATDTDTLGQLMLAIHESGALPVWCEFQVMPANVWDSLFGADQLLVEADALSATAKGHVNTEVLDVLNVDTFAEIGQETPAATQTIRKMLAYMYKLSRNRLTSTSSTINVFNDDGTTVGQKSTHSNVSGTYDRGEFTTGP